VIRYLACPAVSWPSDEAVRAGRCGACVIEEHETARGVATLYRRHRDEYGYEWWSRHACPPESTA
jgi:hypothetical protein